MVLSRLFVVVLIAVVPLHLLPLSVQLVIVALSQVLLVSAEVVLLATGQPSNIVLLTAG